MHPLTEEEEEEGLVLVGRVEGEGEDPLVSAARMEMSGRVVDKRRGGQVVLAVGGKDGEDGRRVTVDLEPEKLGTAELSGRWDEVAAKRVARLFRDDAPGDHVKVKIDGTAVFPGDILAVRGVALEEGSGGGGSYRESPDRVVTAVRALVAAVGGDEAAARAGLAKAEDEARKAKAKRERDDAERYRKREEELEQKAAAKTRPPSPAVPFRLLAQVTLSMATILFVVAAWFARGWYGLIPQGVGAVISWIVALHLLGVAVYAWTVRFDLPLVHEVGVNRPTVKREPWPLYLQFGLITVSCGIGAAAAGGGRWHDGLRLATAVTAAIPLVLLIVAVVRAWRPARRMWLAARARRLTADAADGTWGVLAGTAGDSEGGGAVLSATTTRTGRSRTYTVTVANKDGGSSLENRTDSWDDVTTSYHTLTELQLSAGGRTAHVATGGAIWSAPPIWQPVAKKAAESARAVATVAPGDRVRVLGRIHRKGDELSFKTGGPESLFIVGGSPAQMLLIVLAPVLAQAALIAATAVASLW